MDLARLKTLTPLILSVLAALPGPAARLLAPDLAPPVTALISGAAILGASFILLWACDLAQADISQALALAVVALIAVLPEYAVDMYFTWQAGKQPLAGYAHYAVANMTGANRLLIGVAWAVVAAIHWLSARTKVDLETERADDIIFLGLATAYAFLIPLKGSLTWIDGLVFIAIYVVYIRRAAKRHAGECEFSGPLACLAGCPQGPRRLITLSMFVFAAAVILVDAEPFSESLIATGRLFEINEFLLVQWLAPIASEAPEFTVAIMFAMRGQAGVALGSLISAKLNQWTLLVGMIPGVYGLSAGSFASPIPMDAFQMGEILLTAAQSLLAVVLIAGFSLSFSGAMLLFVLFAGQFATPFLPRSVLDLAGPGLSAAALHHGFSLAYLICAAGLAAAKPSRITSLLRQVRNTRRS